MEEWRDGSRERKGVCLCIWVCVTYRTFAVSAIRAARTKHGASDSDHHNSRHTACPAICSRESCWSPTLHNKVVCVHVHNITKRENERDG